MIEIGSYWLLRPYWLLAVPLLLAIYGFYHHQGRAGFGVWRNVMDATMRRFAEHVGYFYHAKHVGILPIILAALLVISCALVGVAKRDEAAVTFRNVNTLAIIIDMSDSITEGGGLGLMKATAQRLIDTANGRPTAIVLFASQSYLAAAPSLDPQSASSVISVLDPTTMPDKGSRPDRALQTVTKMLKLSGAQNADVVILSDGGGVGAEAEYEAEVLHRNFGARVFAIFAPAPIAPYGAPPVTRGALEVLAQKGGGEVVNIDDAERLVEDLQRSAQRVPRAASKNSSMFIDYGRWVLLLSLPFVLLLFRRKADV